MMAAKVKIAAQVLLFVLAVVVFYLGLGVGLQINPTLGSILWFYRRGHIGFGPGLDCPVSSLMPHRPVPSAVLSPLA